MKKYNLFATHPSKLLGRYITGESFTYCDICVCKCRRLCKLFCKHKSEIYLDLGEYASAGLAAGVKNPAPEILNKKMNIPEKR